MFFLKEVFGILTLQTGTIVLSSLFITLAVSVLLKNILLLDVEIPVAWIIMFLFVLVLIMIWLTAFLGAYNESLEITSAAAISWTVYILLWTGLVAWSLISTQSNKRICLEFTCPDGLWLLYNSRCDLYTENQSTESQISTTTKKQNDDMEPRYEKTAKPHTVGVIKKHKPVKGKKQNRTACVPRATTPMEVVENTKKELIEEVEIYNINNIDMIADTLNRTSPEPKCNFTSTMASIIFSILYAIILIFSWMVLISYRKEIQLQMNFTTNVQETPSFS